MMIQTSDTQSPLQSVPNLVNTARCAVLFSLIVYQGVLSIAIDDRMVTTGFYIWCLTYFLIITLALFAPSTHPRLRALQPMSGVVDIVMMSILMYLSGGINSGLGILILPFVATACLMSSGRYTFTYAALTTILIFFFSLIGLDHPLETLSTKTSETYIIFNAGLLAGAAFLVAWPTSFAMRHIQRATDTISEHQDQIIRLSQLNSLVLNRVQEAIIVIDKQHKILLHNAQATIYFPPALLAQQSKQNIFQPVLNLWRNNHNLSFEYLGDIHQLPVRIRAISMHDINPPILMLFIRSEEDIAQESQADKLASLGQLTANIAHEIRNPLSAIRHANELLFESNQNAFTDKLERMINSNIDRIDKLLEEVLALNKRLKPKVEAIDLREFLPEFLQDIYLSIPESQGKISMQFFMRSTIVMFDRNHLRQILWNLVNNAWRHSQQDLQAIKIYGRPDGYKDRLLLHVIDNGKGISPEIHRKIFEPFFTTEHHGTGLGLFIARELAQSNLSTLQYLLGENTFELSLPRVEYE